MQSNQSMILNSRKCETFIFATVLKFNPVFIVDLDHFVSGLGALYGLTYLFLYVFLMGADGLPG